MSKYQNIEGNEGKKGTIQKIKETILKHPVLFTVGPVIVIGVTGTVVKKVHKSNKIKKFQELCNLNVELKEKHRELITINMNGKEMSNEDVINYASKFTNYHSDQSYIMSSLIENLKSGRNKPSEEEKKLLCLVAGDIVMKSRDKVNIFRQICDGHVKTKDELIAEAQIQAAKYGYLKKVAEANVIKDKNDKNYRVAMANIKKEENISKNNAATIVSGIKAAAGFAKTSGIK